jgi:hypothetical protein
MHNSRNDIRKHDPWWAQTWWGQRTTALNVGIVVIGFLIILWQRPIPIAASPI